MHRVDAGGSPRDVVIVGSQFRKLDGLACLERIPGLLLHLHVEVGVEPIVSLKMHTKLLCVAVDSRLYHVGK